MACLTRPETRMDLAMHYTDHNPAHGAGSSLSYDEAKVSRQGVQLEVCLLDLQGLLVTGNRTAP